MDLIVNMDDMEMADLLDELTYRLLANAASRAQARDGAGRPGRRLRGSPRERSGPPQLRGPGRSLPMGQ
jgi:hypothetical protein